MKIFLLTSEVGDDTQIHAAYSTKEKAMEAIPFTCPGLTENNIEAYEVDPPHGEKFVEYFSYGVFQNGEKYNNYRHWQRPSEFGNNFLKFLVYSERPDKFIVIAYSPVSLEEAERIARESIPLIQPVWQVAQYQNSPGMCCLRLAHPKEARPWEFPYAIHADLEEAKRLYAEMVKEVK